MTDRRDRSPLAACPGCGKQAFTSRKVARRAAPILYPGQRMRAYQCGETPGWWHLTSRPAAKAAYWRDQDAASG